MNILPLILLVLTITIDSYGQENDKLTIMSQESSEQSFKKKGVQYFRRSTETHSIIYESNSSDSVLTAKYYFINTESSLRRGDTVIENIRKKKLLEYNGTIDQEEYQTMMLLFQQRIDNVVKDSIICESEFKEMGISLWFLSPGKQKINSYRHAPFEDFQYWCLDNRSKAIDISELDIFLINSLPKSFLGIKELRKTSANNG